MKADAGITESKAENFAEWYTQVVTRAELADYAPVKGTMALRPDGYAIWESLRLALDAEFSKLGVRNAFLPVLIPESLLNREKSHFEGFNPEVFWVTHSGGSEVGDRLALRPTSETIAYSLYSKWIKSWRDLPLKLNFWNTALRAEIKSTKPFLRTSEFLWQEGHTAHATKKEAEEQVGQMLEVYCRVVETHLAVPVERGRKSKSEQFVGAEYTLTVESVMPDGRALQMGTSHMLGQNFARPFGVKFADRDNVEHHAWQTSWGVSWRLLGAMIMVHGDDRGLALPPRVAPVQVVVVPIRPGERDGVLAEAGRVAGALRDAGVRVHLDDREQFTPGYKFNDWEMRGVPLRVEVGPRDVRERRVATARRDTGAKGFVDAGSAAAEIPRMLEAIQNDMLEAARGRAAALTFDVTDRDSLAAGAKSGGFMRAHWCGDAACEGAVKGETGADIRLVRDASRSGAVCVRCGGEAAHEAVFARGY